MRTAGRLALALLLAMQGSLASFLSDCGCPEIGDVPSALRSKLAENIQWQFCRYPNYYRVDIRIPATNESQQYSTQHYTFVPALLIEAVHLFDDVPIRKEPEWLRSAKNGTCSVRLPEKAGQYIMSATINDEYLEENICTQFQAHYTKAVVSELESVLSLCPKDRFNPLAYLGLIDHHHHPPQQIALPPSATYSFGAVPRFVILSLLFVAIFCLGILGGFFVRQFLAYRRYAFLNEKEWKHVMDI